MTQKENFFKILNLLQKSEQFLQQFVKIFSPTTLSFFHCCTDKKKEMPMLYFVFQTLFLKQREKCIFFFIFVIKKQREIGGSA
jgi:hypothetical protein